MKSNFHLKSRLLADHVGLNCRIYPDFNHASPCPLLSCWLVAQTALSSCVFPYPSAFLSSQQPEQFFWKLVSSCHSSGLASSGFPVCLQEEPGLYWPPGLHNHQFHHSPDLNFQPLSSLSLLCSQLAFLFSSDTQNTALPWDSYISIPWNVCLPFLLKSSFSYVYEICVQTSLYKWGLLPSPPSTILSDLLSNYIFS